MKNKQLCIGIVVMLFLISCVTSDAECIPPEIPFEFENGRIILSATVNGTDGKFMWDTGAFDSAVNIPIDNLPLKGVGTTEGYTEKLNYYTIKNGIVFDGIPLNSESQISKVPEFLAEVIAYVNTQGILGISIFDGYWCEVSFSKSKIILYKKKPKNFIKSVSAKIFDKSYFCVPAKIDGNKILFSLDTGAVTSCFPELIVNKKQPSDSVPVVSETRPETYYFVKTKKIKIFDKIFKNKIIRTTASIYKYPLPFGVLGTEFLQDYDLLFDFTNLRNYKTTKLYYEPRFPADTEKNELYDFVHRISLSGIVSVYFIEQGVRIHEIIENGLAYTIFGLRPGTIITKIDGVPISDIVKDVGIEKCARKIGDATESTEFTILENGIEYIPKKNK